MQAPIFQSTWPFYRTLRHDAYPAGSVQPTARQENKSTKLLLSSRGKAYPRSGKIPVLLDTQRKTVRANFGYTLILRLSRLTIGVLYVRHNDRSRHSTLCDMWTDSRG